MEHIAVTSSLHDVAKHVGLWSTAPARDGLALTSLAEVARMARAVCTDMYMAKLTLAITGSAFTIAATATSGAHFA